MKKIFCFKCNKLITNKDFKEGAWGIEFIGLDWFFKCEKCTKDLQVFTK